MHRSKLFFICIIISVLFFVLSGCAGFESSESSSSEEEIEYTEDYYDRKFMDEVLSEEEKRENIFSALTDINMNTEFIKEFQKIEDETGIEKYSFIYRENNFTVIMEPDSTVSSVRVGEDGEDVYLKGYESYDVEDYIMTDNMIAGFKHSIINAVEISFDYPSIYEIANDWVYRHEGDFYYASGTVLIGESKAEHFIDMVYYYEEAENTMHWYSLTVDGKSISLERVFAEPEIAERQPLSGE